MPCMEFVVIVDIAPNAFIVKVFNRDAFVKKEDIVSFCVFKDFQTAVPLI